MAIRAWTLMFMVLVSDMALRVQLATRPPDYTIGIAAQMKTIFAATMIYAAANPAFAGMPPSSAYSGLDAAPNATVAARIDASHSVFVFTISATDGPATAANLQDLTEYGGYAGIVAGGNLMAPAPLGAIPAPSIPNGAAAIWGKSQ